MSALSNLNDIFGRFPAVLIALGWLLAACAGSPNPPAATSTSAPPATVQASSATPPAAVAAATVASATLASAINTAPAAAQPPATPPTFTPGITTAPKPTSSPVPNTPTAAPASASTLPDGKAFQWKLAASGLIHPVAIANAGDGSDRLFIIEQPGEVRILQGGLLLAAPFLDIRGRVGSNGTEQGLLGIAFHPGYKDSGLFYLDYTDKNGNTNISRFKVGGDPNQADPASEKILLHIQQPYPNHNGGQLAFGPDGYLYIGMGDGGSQGDPLNNGQSLKVLLGKLLRIDVDHGDPYAIPPENPLAKGGGRPEILAYGLRNPWRFSFDPTSGDWYIADVGQDKYEEIDILPAGTKTLTNYGWSIREGLHPYKGGSYSGLVPLTNPVAEYDHSLGCAIIGGYIYRGPSLAEFHGVYLYADNCSGRVWGLLKTGSQWESSQLFSTNLAPTTFGLDEKGEIYLASLDGSIFQLVRK